MTNIILTTATLTLTLTVPAGAVVSILENGQKQATITTEAQATIEGQAVEQINVVVDLGSSSEFKPVEVTDGQPSPSPTPGITPTPVVNSFSNVPQATANTYANVPQASPADYNNIIRNASPTPTPDQELAQLRQEVAQLRLAMQTTPTPQPSPIPQNTITETTIINPQSNQPTQRTVTVQRTNVTPTPIPTKTPTATPVVGAVPSASAAQIIP